VKHLLDTHILLWWFSRDARLRRSHERAIKAAGPADPLWVSEITLWEIATLYELGRIRLQLPLRDWLEAATAPPLVRRMGITPAVAAEVAALPPMFHRDPADRIIVATARVLGATLLTQDRLILKSGLAATLA
jgi:PIN domain nuclease of toxin-antitoxin system